MPVLSILGPTASGKTSLAIKLAQRLNGEIISCDSMQVYKGMDIGTAKATREEQSLIPHHLINIYDIHSRYSASRFVELATAAIADIERRGKLPIIAGGTGMYARLFLYGGDMPPADRELHATLRSRLAEEGRESLLAELTEKDPQTAEKVKDNERRLIRALEAVLLTGEKLPGKTTWGDEAIIPGLQVVNMCSPELNRSRITKRTAEMLDSGWIEETKELIDQGLWQTPTAFQSLGYRQIGDFLDGGFDSLAALSEKIVTLTCRYAKRQRTWFRNQHPGALQIMREEGDDIEQVVERVIVDFEKSH
jgi:tRNA dimethylallyltransferase